MKKWKIVMLVIGVVLISTAGFLYYQFNLKDYAIEEDVELAEITETEYEVTLPAPSLPINSGSSSTTTNNPASSSSGSTETEGSETNSNEKDSTQPSSKNQNNSNINTKEKVTVSEIKAKFRPSFESLEQQANSKIDSMISKAIEEYKTKKSNNEEVSFGYFYAKYNSAAEKLESKTNVAFNVVFQALEDELKANGYSPSHAKEFQDRYEATKKERKSALVKRAMEHL